MSAIRRYAQDNYIAGVVIIALLVLTTSANASDKNVTDTAVGQTIITMGKSDYNEKDLNSTREMAIANAIATAVSLKALAIVPPDILTSQFNEVIFLIQQQSQSFVNTFKVLAEHHQSKRYHVLIESVISETAIKIAIEKTGLLDQKEGMPKLLFLIAEQRAGEYQPEFWWGKGNTIERGITSQVLGNEMTALGYVVADERGAMVVEQAYHLELNAEEAAQIGRLYKADIVITGTAVATTAKDTHVTDLKTYRGVLTVRAYRTDTGAQIGISHADTFTVKTNNKTGSDSVLSLLAKNVAEDLSPQLAFHRQRFDSSRPSLIHIEVLGTNHLRRFVALRKALGGLPKVTQVQVKTLTPPTAGVVAHFEGTAKELAAEIIQATKPNLKFNIKVMAEDRLKVNLSP